MKKVLLIGGTGYIGSSIYSNLKNKYEITTVDLEWFGNNINKSNIKADYKDLYYVDDFDTIVLLAGHSTDFMCRDGVSVKNNNIDNFVGFLKLIGKNQKIIYPSSFYVYGDFPYFEKVTETSPILFSSGHYAVSKVLADQILSLTDLKYYCLRLGLVAGPAPNFRSDSLFNSFLARAFCQKGQINYFNEGLRRSVLDIDHISVVIENIIEDKILPGTYNLSSFDIYLRDIVDELLALNLSLESRFNFIQSETKSYYNFFIDNSKISKACDFNFQSSIKDITQKFIINQDKMIYSTRNRDIPYR